MQLATDNGSRRFALEKAYPPAPSAGIESYHRQLALRLAFDPRCAENYRLYEMAVRGARLDYLPVKLDIENVSRCNFACHMCQVSEWSKQKRADDLSLDRFTRLLDEQYGLVEIKLQGVGEPTMGEDAYVEMIRQARQRQIWVRTGSNASRLHLHDMASRLVDAGPNEIQISVDGASKAVFESIRRGSVFEKVIDNCRMINAYCRERNLALTKMWTMVQKANRHQLDDLVALGADIGFPCLVFAMDFSSWGSSAWEARNNNLVAEVTEADARRLVALGAGLGIKVYFWGNQAKFSRGPSGHICHWPFERAFFSSDERVVPCCTIANPDTLSLGNASESLTQVWQSEAYQDFRQAHLNGNIPNACRQCYRD
jgi:pyrroloquinoline quinone biosynthesis protein E